MWNIIAMISDETVLSLISGSLSHEAETSCQRRPEDVMSLLPANILSLSWFCSRVSSELRATPLIDWGVSSSTGTLNEALAKAASGRLLTACCRQREGTGHTAAFGRKMKWIIVLTSRCLNDRILNKSCFANLPSHTQLPPASVPVKE